MRRHEEERVVVDGVLALAGAHQQGPGLGEDALDGHARPHPGADAGQRVAQLGVGARQPRERVTLDEHLDVDVVERTRAAPTVRREQQRLETDRCARHVPVGDPHDHPSALERGQHVPRLRGVLGQVARRGVRGRDGLPCARHGVPVDLRARAQHEVAVLERPAPGEVDDRPLRVDADDPVRVPPHPGGHDVVLRAGEVVEGRLPTGDVGEQRAVVVDVLRLDERDVPAAVTPQPPGHGRPGVPAPDDDDVMTLAHGHAPGPRDETPPR